MLIYNVDATDVDAAGGWMLMFQNQQQQQEMRRAKLLDKQNLAFPCCGKTKGPRNSTNANNEEEI